MIQFIAGACMLFAGEAPLTLDQAIDIAIKNGFSVKTASANIEKMRQKVNEARGSMGPKLVADGTFTELDKGSSVNFGGGSMVIQPKETRTAKFTLSFPIDIMGNINRGVKAARLSLDASKDTYDAQVNDIKLSVRQNYFRVLQAQEMVKVYEEALVGAKGRLSNAEKMFEAGTIAKVDVLRYQTLVAQAESDLISSKNALNLAKSAFNNALGRDVNTEFELAPVSAEPKPELDKDGLIAEAIKGRPEVRALLNQVSALKYVREAEERGMQPSLAVQAVHTQTLDTGLGGRKESSVGVIALSVPIFDSGVTRSRVKAARQDEAIAKTQLDQLRLGVSLEVTQALTNLTNALARIEVARKQVEFAAENYRLAKVRQEAGEGIALEVIDAQTEDSRAKAGLVAATYDYLSAYAALQRAVGKDNPTRP